MPSRRKAHRVSAKSERNASNLGACNCGAFSYGHCPHCEARGAQTVDAYAFGTTRREVPVPICFLPRFAWHRKILNIAQVQVEGQWRTQLLGTVQREIRRHSVGTITLGVAVCLHHHCLANRLAEIDLPYLGYQWSAVQDIGYFVSLSFSKLTDRSEKLLTHCARSWSKKWLHKTEQRTKWKLWASRWTDDGLASRS